jgi:hypothetical protein
VALREFIQEIEVQGVLKHPNIVEVLGTSLESRQGGRGRQQGGDPVVGGGGIRGMEKCSAAM